MGSQCSGVVMIGTELEGRGGMSSVVSAYRAGGLFESCGVTYISSAHDGNHVAKIFAAIGALARYLALLMSGQVRLVHIHTASGVSFWRKSVFALIAYVLGKPVILHVHGGNFIEFYSTASLIGQRLITNIFVRASRVVVLSDVWVGRMSRIVDAKKCIVIENPVVPPSDGVPIRHNAPPVRFVFLGRLEADKGVYELIEAFSMVEAVIPGVQLIMGGVGELSGCKRFANSLSVESKVEFPGWVVGTAKSQMLRDADVFVLPSHIEALPVSMLEAMSFGLPIVICPVGSIPEVIADEMEAIFVPVRQVGPLAAAMERLARDKILRKALGQRGAATFSKRFSVHSVVPRVARLYQEVLDAPK